MDAVVVDRVFFSYDEVPVLKGVSLRVRLGEVLAIMGENGAGKTTLIRHFNGLLKPKRGRVLVFGVDTREASVAQLSRKVGIVFQNPDHQLFAESVEKEVEFALRNMDYPEEGVKERVEQVLRLLDLEKYRSRSPYSLSVGERKRLTIAAILSYDPDVLVLDEPTAGQDFINKMRIKGLIESLKAQRKAVVIVTHDVEFAAQTADRVVLMVSGEIVCEGPAREILTAPELVMKSRLLMPQIAYSALLLRKRGVALPDTPMLPDELCSELIKLVRQNVA